MYRGESTLTAVGAHTLERGAMAWNLARVAQALSASKLTGSQWPVHGCACKYCEIQRTAHRTGDWPALLGSSPFAARSYEAHTFTHQPVSQG